MIDRFIRWILGYYDDPSPDPLDALYCPPERRASLGGQGPAGPEHTSPQCDGPAGSTLEQETTNADR